MNLPNMIRKAATVVTPDILREQTLLQRLAQQPEDHETRVRLLEHYFERGREQDFLREATVFRARLSGNLDTADWRRIRSLGQSLLPEAPLFREAAPKPAITRRLGEDSRSQRYLAALGTEFDKALADPAFLAELDRELIQVTGRPTPLRHLKRLSENLGGAQLYLKREDFSQPGALLQFQIEGQALFARRLGKKSLVTSTAHGQRGVALAMTAARLGLEAVVYMDAETIANNPANIFRMWLTGAQVVSVDQGPLRGKDVREAALIHCLNNPDSFMALGLDAGPAPYPAMARQFLSVSGRETRRQMLGLARRLPDLVVARAGQNADALGLFQPFLGDAKTRLVCVEGYKELAAQGSTAPGEGDGLTERQKQIADTVMEGMLFPSVEREHLWLRNTGRVETTKWTTEGARQAIQLCSRLEGIVPPIETAHALSYACDKARRMPKESAIVVTLNEGSDKDILRIGRAFGVPL